MSGGSSSNNAGADAPPAKKEYWKLWWFLVVPVLDSVVSVVMVSPLIPAMERARDETKNFTLYGSLLDLSILAACRLLFLFVGLLVSYYTASDPPDFPFPTEHPNGDKKSREELEQEALEESFRPWFVRFISRPSFLTETVALITQVHCVIKSLARMNVEIGERASQDAMHPVFWLALLMSTVLASIEATYMEKACVVAGRLGKERLGDSSSRTGLLGSLSMPLLSDHDGDENGNEQAENGEGQDAEASPDTADVRGVSDIGPDATYKATWTDLLATCLPDLHLICLAFIFLFLAAIAQVYIPRYLGKILDSLALAFDDVDDDSTHHESMFEVPGFMRNVKLLVLASIGAGVFSGLRGSIFTFVGGRVNVRLRVQLMDSLLAQDIGFFDVTKTGDITSRLSSDTTLVGDQVSLNVNVFLRSLVQALGVLLFMFLVSWQLSILAFISVPVITVLSKWYGNYVRSLTKLMQKKLADGNVVSEAALGSMATVRSFDAAEAELKEFENSMMQYLTLNARSSVAYCGYAAFVTALPQLVFAVVVFYGGYLVRNGNMTSGELVSFLLYLQSLSDAFAAIGWVFSSLTQAVGAADKVFELMRRTPRYTKPTVAAPQHATSGISGIKTMKTREQRLSGASPETANGEIVMENVELYYPARPQRRVLNNLTMKIDPGMIVALVGKSGGGKSSLMSLIQHLYEQQNGKVMLDGHEVHELCPMWLSRHISIVSQEPTLFARSIKRNIIYGLEGTDEEPSQEEVEEAARLANAGFIYDFPQKFDTEVGERGVQLSGGQKQRIAIARALVRKPKVLLLDEATSALDAESEHLVQAAIDDMIARGKKAGTEDGSTGAMTVIIAAHRLSTVRNADKIFVIQEGAVVEEGNHDDLLREKPDGAYSALIRRQMEAQRKLENGKEETKTEAKAESAAS